MATKPDCIYYDWGDTAPREYGAFCKKTESCLNKNTCENCNSYFKRIDGDMERLTTRTRYGCKFIGLPPYSNRPEKNKLLSNAANKLATYEDTGLTPERIRELQNAFNILFESERQKQQEAEQLQAHVARMREALRKAREAISAWDRVNWCDCDRCKNMRDALAAIDKVIGGKEDAGKK